MKKIKNILAVDTAMSGCGAAVLYAGGHVARAEDMPRGQSERLMPMICEVVEEAGLGFDDLGAVVVTLGPGAFTGIRIALSTAKALGLSLGVPVYGLSTLQALAFDVVRRGGVDDDFKVLVDTRRDDVYVQGFDMHARPLSSPTLMPFEGVSSQVREGELLIGDAVSRFRDFAGDACLCRFDTDFRYPDPVSMALELEKSAELYTQVIEPIYLRGADVSRSKKVYRVLS